VSGTYGGRARSRRGQRTRNRDDFSMSRAARAVRDRAKLAGDREARGDDANVARIHEPDDCHLSVRCSASHRASPTSSVRCLSWQARRGAAAADWRAISASAMAAISRRGRRPGSISRRTGGRGGGRPVRLHGERGAIRRSDVARHAGTTAERLDDMVAQTRMGSLLSRARRVAVRGGTSCKTTRGDPRARAAAGRSRRRGCWHGAPATSPPQAGPSLPTRLQRGCLARAGHCQSICNEPCLWACAERLYIVGNMSIMHSGSCDLIRNFYREFDACA
jgi:hypothetical protein